MKLEVCDICGKTLHPHSKRDLRGAMSVLLGAEKRVRRVHECGKAHKREKLFALSVENRLPSSNPYPTATASAYIALLREDAGRARRATFASVTQTRRRITRRLKSAGAVHGTNSWRGSFSTREKTTTRSHERSECLNEQYRFGAVKIICAGR